MYLVHFCCRKSVSYSTVVDGDTKSSFFLCSYTVGRGGRDSYPWFLQLAHSFPNSLLGFEPFEQEANILPLGCLQFIL